MEKTLEQRLRLGAWSLIPISAVVGYLTHPSVVEAISSVMLLVIAAVCFAIFNERYDRSRSVITSKPRIWLLISIGFVFLMLDETFSIHEQLDGLIHEVFALEETALTDRFDDMLILVYGIIGLIFMYSHRMEFRGLSSSFIYLAGGFAFLVVMVAIDAATNRDDVLPLFIEDPDERKAIAKHLGLFEEITKIVAQVLFLLGFARMYDLFKQRKAGAA